MGARYDWKISSIRARDSNNNLYFDDISFSYLSASVGIEHVFNDEIFRTNIAFAWRPPSVSELYSFGRHQASIEYGFWRYEELNGDISTASGLTQKEKKVSPEIGWKWINSLTGKRELISWEMVF